MRVPEHSGVGGMDETDDLQLWPGPETNVGLPLQSIRINVNEWVH